MKKLLLTSLWAALAAVLFVACDKSDPEPDPTLSTTAPASILFSADGAKAYDDAVEVTPTFTVATNQDSWDVAVTPTTASWCTVTRSGDTFTVSAEPNTSETAPEAATVTVTAEGATPVTIAVTQQGAVYDTYVAGYYYTDAENKTIPCLWTNGTLTDLTLPAGAEEGYGKSVAVSGTTVCVAGDYWSADDKSIACLWTNGTRTELAVPAGTNYSEARSVALSGTTVCVAGRYNTGDDIACLWRNGVRTDLAIPAGAHGANATSVAVVAR